jgi:hypothetical protein
LELYQDNRAEVFSPQQAAFLQPHGNEEYQSEGIKKTGKMYASTGERSVF